MIIFFVFVTLALSSNVLADQYGGFTPSLSIIIDKKVAKPGTTKGGANVCDGSLAYVDNFATTNDRFHSGDDVCFQVRIKNTSNEALNNVTVTDTVPSYVEPVDGPGTYNKDNRTVTFTPGSFAVDEEKIYYMRMRVVANENLANDRTIMCVVNRAEARTPNPVSDTDTAQFCIEKTFDTTKGGVPVKQPTSGPEFAWLILAGQFAALGAGAMLIKKAK